MKIQVKGLSCPKCGNGEMHPSKDVLLIRGYKVFDEGSWWSQCLVCAGYYDKDLNYDQTKGDSNKGWFAN